MFQQPNLYLTFEPVFDCILKINAHFKEGIKKVNKHHDSENAALKQANRTGNMLDSLKLQKSSNNSINRNKIQ